MKKTVSYRPIQPELQKNSDSFIEYRPSKHESPEVILFYQFHLQEETGGNIAVIPDGCFDLLFSCNPHDPFAVLATSPEQRTSYQFQTNCTYFGVRLAPEQQKIKFQCSAKEILQYQQISLEQVAYETEGLLDLMANSSNFEERIKAFTSYLNKKKSLETDYNQNLIGYCLNKMYHSRGRLNIKDLSADTGYSERYIRKKFEEFIGFSPKKINQIIRLQDYISNFVMEEEDFEPLFAEHGYYDVAHFYKEFKKFMALTPKQYQAKLIS